MLIILALLGWTLIEPATDTAAIARHYGNRAGKYPEIAWPIRWLT